MIRLVGTNTRQYIGSITHNGGGPPTSYPITHNLNTKRIHVELVDETNNAIVLPLYYNGVNDSGFYVSGLTNNSCNVIIFKWYPNGSQNATQTVTVIVTAL